MVARPCDQGGILVGQVGNMVIHTRAIGVAHPFCVPRQAYGLGAVPFGDREGRNAASLDFVTNFLGFEGADFVGAKKALVKGVIFDT